MSVETHYSPEKIGFDADMIAWVRGEKKFKIQNEKGKIEESARGG